MDESLTRADEASVFFKVDHRVRKGPVNLCGAVKNAYKYLLQPREVDAHAKQPMQYHVNLRDAQTASMIHNELVGFRSVLRLTKTGNMYAARPGRGENLFQYLRLCAFIKWR